MGKNKGTEKNSKRYKSQVKHDIEKKSADKASRNKHYYSNNGGGSRVVRRGRSDIYTAPSYYGDRIKRGGIAHYGHYYPYQEGVLDRQMALTSYYDRALKQHQSKNQWSSMIAGLSAGKFEDLDQQRKDLLAQQVIEEEKRQKLEDIKRIEKNIADTKTANKAKLRELQMGEDADPATIAARNERVKREIDRHENASKGLVELRDNLEAKRQAEHDFRGIARDLQSEFRNDSRVSRIKNIEDLGHGLVQQLSDEITHELERVKPELQQFMQIRGKLRELHKANEDMSNMEAEFEGLGRNNPILAGVLAKKKQIYGGPRERIAEINEAVKEQEQVIDGWFKGTLPRLRNKVEQLRKQSEYYMETRNEYRKQAIQLLLDSERLSPEIHKILQENPEKATDLDLSNLMQNAIPTFFESNNEYQQRLQFYYDMFKKYTNPTLMRVLNWEQYLGPLSEVVQTFDDVINRRDMHFTDDARKVMEERMLNVARKLLRNHHLGEKVQYGPELNIDYFPNHVVEVPLDPYGYETEKHSIKLELSDTNAPIKTGYEPVIARKRSKVVFEAPEAPPELEESEAIGISYIEQPGLESDITQSFSYDNPYNSEEEKIADRDKFRQAVVADKRARGMTFDEIIAEQKRNEKFRAHQTTLAEVMGEEPKHKSKPPKPRPDVQTKPVQVRSMSFGEQVRNSAKKLLGMNMAWDK